MGWRVKRCLEQKDVFFCFSSFHSDYFSSFMEMHWGFIADLIQIDVNYIPAYTKENYYSNHILSEWRNTCSKSASKTLEQLPLTLS